MNGAGGAGQSEMGLRSASDKVHSGLVAERTQPTEVHCLERALAPDEERAPGSASEPSTATLCRPGARRAVTLSRGSSAPGRTSTMGAGPSSACRGGEGGGGAG